MPGEVVSKEQVLAEVSPPAEALGEPTGRRAG
jgi:hypothetical protein